MLKITTLKTMLIACLVLTATSYSNAQFKIETKTSIGQVYELNQATGVAVFDVNFNTDKSASSWEMGEGDVISISLSKCQTNRGLQMNVYDIDGTTAVVNGDFKCDRWNSNGNPVRVSSTASLIEILNKFVEKDPLQVKNLPWQPAHCLFDTDAEGTNQAFGAYPGKYKIVKYGFQYNFSGIVVKNDISFDIDTYDAGNTGATASYDLKVAIGSESADPSVATGFYVTGSGKQTIKVAELLGLSPSDFTNQKVYIIVETTGTGTEIDEAKYDPIVVFDNLSVEMQVPVWIEPATGAAANAIADNVTNPATGIQGEEETFGLNLKTESRIGVFTIVDDLQDNTTKYITFAETGAVKANDGEGNYTVDVDYTLAQSVKEGGTWSKAKITIAAPESGPVNDDIMIYFTATPRASTLVNKFELSCGTRIWYDYNIVSSTTSIGKVNTIEEITTTVFPNPVTDQATFNIALTEISVVSITLYNTFGQKVKEVEAKNVTVGKNQVFMQVSDLSSGIYLYVVEAGSKTITGKLSIVK
ncbi:MAG TPA: T9SS type A sorting domain-containing protein [Marinilabiliaceae bacterium]|nr:T9SS type A sorting domain-containing protein [Marinilabiliaceae bacterium]